MASENVLLQDRCHKSLFCFVWTKKKNKFTIQYFCMFKLKSPFFQYSVYLLNLAYFHINHYSFCSTFIYRVGFLWSARCRAFVWLLHVLASCENRTDSLFLMTNDIHKKYSRECFLPSSTYEVIYTTDWAGSLWLTRERECVHELSGSAYISPWKEELANTAFG